MWSRWYPCIIPTVVTTVIKQGFVRYLIDPATGGLMMTEYTSYP